MCGIFGAINADVSSKVETIVQTLRKRGPDGFGVYKVPQVNVTFIHTRLSIIDTSSIAKQPMEYGDFVIVFNGEIYNYRLIRAELESLGYTFKSHSDTEVVLVSFIAWNEKCLTKFRGMFAFGIYNKVNHEFFAARDHFGIKPFYYFHQNNIFLFSSLLITLLESGIPSKNVNKKGLSIYLQTGSFTNEETIIENIKQLKPGHYLTLHNGILRIKSYWDITQEAMKQPKPLCYHEAVNILRDKLEESARYQLVADVPVGAFLSGGVDSAIAVGLMSQYSSSKLNTFTVGFEKKHADLNELDGARITSKMFGTNHHELIINDDSIHKHIDEYISSIDQPSIDGLNTYFIAKETSQFTKVAVTGLGSDELFGGYPHFIYAGMAERKIPKALSKLTCLVKLLPIIPNNIKELLEYVNLNPENRHWLIRNYGIKHPVSIKLREITEKKNHEILLEYYNGYVNTNLDAVQQLSLWEINKYLLNTLLRDGDALSMSQSLEVRPIFLDHQLASYIFSLKADYKVKFKLRKRILIDACKDLLPLEIFTKKKNRIRAPIKALASA